MVLWHSFFFLGPTHNSPYQSPILLCYFLLQQSLCFLFHCSEIHPEAHHLHFISKSELVLYQTLSKIQIIVNIMCHKCATLTNILVRQRYHDDVTSSFITCSCFCHCMYILWSDVFATVSCHILITYMGCIA